MNIRIFRLSNNYLIAAAGCRGSAPTTRLPVAHHRHGRLAGGRGGVSRAGNPLPLSPSPATVVGTPTNVYPSLKQNKIIYRFY